MFVNLIAIALCVLGSLMALKFEFRDPDCYWRNYNRFIPRDALPTGQNIYIGQILVEETAANIPGTLYPKSKVLVSEVTGQKVVKDYDIKILCTKEARRFIWQNVNVEFLNETVLERCLIGGFEAESVLYIGKIFHQNEWKIAKVFPPSSIYKGLRAWTNDGGLHIADDFEILMFKE